MSYKLEDLNNAIFKNSYKLLKTIFTENNKNTLINNNCSKKNTLNNSIRSILGSRNLCGFSLKSIEILVKNGAKVINSDSAHNTLNLTLICSKLYIKSFCQPDEKIIAEQNAIKVIDLVIKNGAKPVNQRDPYTSMGENTLSALIGTGNLNIIRSVIDHGLHLEPVNDQNNNTMECSLIKLQETKEYEFFKIALEVHYQMIIVLEL